MKFEFSAGGVVYKREQTQKKSESRTNAKKGGVFILLAKHAMHHGWVFPKGLIGDTIEKESKEDTAVREVKEETGIEARILTPLVPISYWYQFEGEKIKKTVYYFIMEYVSGNFSDRDDEMEDVEWLDIEDVESRLTYTSDKKVWQEAKSQIANKK